MATITPLIAAILVREVAEDASPLRGRLDNKGANKSSTCLLAGEHFLEYSDCWKLQKPVPEASREDVHARV